jgi:hypothetical protein
MRGVEEGDLDAWEDYVDLSAELFLCGDDSLSGLELGKKKKSFFSKIGSVLKKVSKKIIPAAMAVAGAYTGNVGLVSAGVSGLLAKDRKVRGPSAVAAQSGVVLQEMGVQLPAQMQGFVTGVNNALSPEELAAAKAQVLAASGNDSDIAHALGLDKVPVWGWVAAGGGALVLLGAVVFAVSRGGSAGGKKK